MQNHWFRIFKILLSVGIAAVIFRYFFHFENLPIVISTIAEVPLFCFAIVLFSAATNWGIESRKWQVLLKNLEYFTYTKAIKSTCSGAAVSNILPFRIGEYLGRIVYVKPENRIPAAFNSVLGSSTQFVVSITFGIPALFFTLPKSFHHLIVYAIITIIVLCVSFALLFLYFRQHQNFKLPWLIRLGQDIQKFTTKQILHVFWLSLLRYVVFSSCYVFLLIWFNITTDVLIAYAGVATVYFLQSFAPSIIITDAGLRTALPLIVFHPTRLLEANLLAAALINYAFNILLPSLVGLYFVISQKIKTK